MQKDIEAKKKVVVGVNQFVSESSPIEDIIRIDAAEAAKQKQSLAKVKKERDQEKAAKALVNLESVAKGTGNTMPAFVECAEAYVSIGEMCGVLRNVFGEQKEFLVF